MSSKDRSASLSDDAIAGTAAQWVMRQDRTLSPDEQDKYLDWLAKDPRHSEAMEKCRRTWESFDRLGGLQSTVAGRADPDLLAPAPASKPRTWRLMAWTGPLLASAAMIALLLRSPTELPSIAQPRKEMAAGMPQMAPIEDRTLEDGSIIRLNRGAAITVEFSAHERHVILTRGEGSFEVSKDPTRPFVVESSGVAVRAVGTAFNVRLGRGSVEVIVTEGRVVVARNTAPAGTVASALDAGQRAVVLLNAGDISPIISTLTAEELRRRLAWLPRLLTFADQPLPAILDEFSRQNSVRLRIDDPALHLLRLSARFRSDNLEGFLRLLESDFNVRAHYGPDGEIGLRSAP